MREVNKSFFFVSKNFEMKHRRCRKNRKPKKKKKQESQEMHCCSQSTYKCNTLPHYLYFFFLRCFCSLLYFIVRVFLFTIGYLIISLMRRLLLSDGCGWCEWIFKKKKTYTLELSRTRCALVATAVINVATNKTHTAPSISYFCLYATWILVATFCEALCHDEPIFSLVFLFL